MNNDKKYFSEVFCETLPQLKFKQIAAISSRDSGDKRLTANASSKVEPKKKIYYIEGGNKIDSVDIQPANEISIQIDPAAINRFYLENEAIASNGKILAAFNMANKPAIIHDGQKESIYFLFDLQKLFCGLSRMEHEYAKADKHGRFLASYLSQESKWKYPILDIISELIQDNLDLSKRKAEYGIVLTHDVDRIGTEPLLALKNVFSRKKLSLARFDASKDTLFRKICEIAEIDVKNKIRSLWFFLSGRYSFRRYGNRYSIDSSKARSFISVLKRHHLSFGLHTSYYAAFNSNAMLTEKNSLARLSGRPIVFNRNHYLRFDIGRSVPSYEDCKMRVDSTIGFADKNGFRSALARPFYLWNAKANRQSSVLELPLLFMDSVHGKDLASSWDDITRILYWIKRVRGLGAFLFHPCFLAQNGENGEFYLNFIQECRRLDIPFVSADNMIANRRSDIN
jgi:hypothetical protein